MRQAAAWRSVVERREHARVFKYRRLGKVGDSGVCARMCEAGGGCVRQGADV